MAVAHQLRSCARKYSPTSLTCASNPSRSMASMTAMATAQASGPPPKVVPCMPGLMERATASVSQHRPQRQAAGQRLGHRHHVRHDAVVLVGEPAPGAAHAALDLVDDQQRAVTCRQPARRLQELPRDGLDPAFALDRLDAHGARRRIELALEIPHVVRAHKAHARNQRLEGLAIFGGRRGGKRSEGTAVERIFQSQKAPCRMRAILALGARVGAGELQRALPRPRCRCCRRTRDPGRRCASAVSPAPPGSRDRKGWRRGSACRPAGPAPCGWPDAHGRARSRRYRLSKSR